MAMPAPGRVRRGYIGVGSGQLHYRIAGQDPSVLLVPEPPRSSAVYTPLMESLGDEFTLIALDLPGYGNSSPLSPAAPAATHFATAIAEALHALGVSRCPVYGYHGSSKIVLQLAVTHRDLVTVAVLDGLSLPLELPDAQFLQRLLPPFELSDDGSHIVREWSRILDAQRLYPCFARHERARLSSGVPEAATLHAQALDLFSAGVHYSSAISAIQRCDALHLIPQVEAPTVVMAREDDFLYRALDALPEQRPANVSVERLRGDDEQWRSRLRLIFREHCDRGASPPTPRPQSVGAAEKGCYLDLAHGQLHVM